MTDMACRGELDMAQLRDGEAYGILGARMTMFCRMRDPV